MDALRVISFRLVLLVDRLNAQQPRLSRALGLLAIAWGAWTPVFGAAAEYPLRPIRYIVHSAAGGSADTHVRVFTAELGKQFGQQIIVDNRPGAGGLIGIELIARAAPDGYTIGFGNVVSLAINRSLVAKLPYDPDKDLQVVAQTHFLHNLLAVTLSLPVKSVRELIDYAKKNPGKLLYASIGNGSTPHLAGELFKAMTGTQIVHVPYKSGPQATADLIGGQVQLMFDNLPSGGAHVKAGKLRGLGVTGPKRSPVFPELPTIAEAGVPGYEITPWAGVIVPAGVPKAIVARLNAATNQALASPALREKYAAIGVEPVGGTPAQFAELIRKETVKWAAVVKRSGAKID